MIFFTNKRIGAGEAEVGGPARQSRAGQSLAGQSAGFSLLETLLAIAILMIALVGPMTLAQSALSAASDARNEITASYLTQEAVEYIKNLRDQNTLNGGTGTAWLSNIDTSCFSSSGCDVDSISASFVPCSANACVLKIWHSQPNGLADIYTHSSGTDLSPFTRTINITYPDNSHPDEALVTVKVIWSNHAQSRQLTINELLYNYEQAQ